MHICKEKASFSPGTVFLLEIPQIHASVLWEGFQQRFLICRRKSETEESTNHYYVNWRFIASNFHRWDSSARSPAERLTQCRLKTIFCPQKCSPFLFLHLQVASKDQQTGSGGKRPLFLFQKEVNGFKFNIFHSGFLVRNETPSTLQ